MSRFQNFLKDRGGATAALISVALVPIIGTLAIAIDYSKAVKQKYTLQQVVDSTATAMAMDTDLLLLTQDQLDARALQYAKSVAGANPVDGLHLVVKVDADTVSIVADGQVKLSFAKVLGVDNLLVTASVAVERAKARKIELALALDNTGSMGGTKITELKTAVRALADFMGDKTKNSGETKISLVPFTTFVRTDPAWISSAMLQGSAPKDWDGCLTDREQPYDVSDISPSVGGQNVRHRYKNSSNKTISCGNLAQITPLTSDLQKIKSAADAMIASGNTNVPIGIAWAWNSLTTTAPLTQASAKGTKDVIRAMIVLTDGDNTSNYWGGNNGNAIDKRMAEVCNGVKGDGVVLYTIRVLDGNAAALKSCATSETHYYNITHASQLTPVFQQIASSLSKLRITK